MSDSSKRSLGRMIKFHQSNAERLAFNIMSMTMAILPQELIRGATEEFFDNLFIFAYHARRVTELTDIGKDDELNKENYFGHKGVEDAVKYKYIEILNYLMHSQSITIGSAKWSGKKVWNNSAQDTILAYLKVRTDWKEEKIFYVFPLVNHFLHYINPKLIAAIEGAVDGDSSE